MKITTRRTDAFIDIKVDELETTLFGNSRELEEAIENMQEFIDELKLLRDGKSESPFESVAKPLMKWLCENKHPHTTAIVTGNVAELVEGVENIKTDEFIVD